MKCFFSCVGERKTKGGTMFNLKVPGQRCCTFGRPVWKIKRDLHICFTPVFSVDLSSQRRQSLCRKKGQFCASSQFTFTFASKSFKPLIERPGKIDAEQESFIYRHCSIFNQYSYSFWMYKRKLIPTIWEKTGNLKIS